VTSSLKFFVWQSSEPFELVQHIGYGFTGVSTASGNDVIVIDARRMCGRVCAGDA
jgi:hypothetical protein